MSKQETSSYSSNKTMGQCKKVIRYLVGSLILPIIVGITLSDTVIEIISKIWRENKTWPREYATWHESGNEKDIKNILKLISEYDRDNGKTPDEKFRWALVELSIAANAKYPPAMYFLGRIHCRGIDGIIEHSRGKAIFLIREAADAGFEPAKMHPNDNLCEG